ncbi:hypothetical protein SERLA73DRAFT_74336 [Serpula lacrymans var. lacrymans S7.3]|uniref:Ubiquitin-like protease family profile domain-containing protein n=1 Tax=Serpula lacrymans var. lacrymans (strain S7.3) TaxID=936435 RepID=F8Q1B1_SERL3|nr:hypothetical protein SERLA73DRAFT_74336 [Serpula lacrymans var. lacrymans S7.3]
MFTPYDMVIFTSPSSTARCPLDAKNQHQYLLFPCNKSNTHWVLMIVDVENRTIVGFNSLKFLTKKDIVQVEKYVLTVIKNTTPDAPTSRFCHILKEYLQADSQKASSPPA